MKPLKALIFALALTACATDNRPLPVFATANETGADGRASWEVFMADNDAARSLNENTAAVLIFPNTVKAGFIGGGVQGSKITRRLRKN